MKTFSLSLLLFFAVPATITWAAQTPIITSAPQVSAPAGSPFTYQITAVNSPTSFSASGLPSGLSVNAQTGLISGTPSGAGAFYATIQATNSAGTAQADLTILVNSGIPPAITSPLTAQATAGVPYSYQITLAGSGNNYQATGLPPGLTLSSVTGAISGTPTHQGTYYVNLQINTPVSEDTAILVLTVNAGSGPLPTITSAVSAQGQVNVPYTYQIAATNGPSSYYAAGLPPGLLLNATTGLITGTPTLSGTFGVLVSASNSNGAGDLALSLTINAALVQLPVITSPLTAQGAFNSSFNPYQITATGGPTSFNAANLPPGLNFDATIGEIYGTPFQAGTFPVTLSATNSAGTGTTTLTVTINSSNSPPNPNPRPGELQLGDVVATPGGTVTIPIYYTPSPDLNGGIIGFNTVLPPHVSLIAVSPGPPAMDAGDQASDNPALGKIILLNLSNNLLGPGTIVNLILHVDSGIPGGTLPVSLAYVGMTDPSTTVNIPLTVVDGAITVNGPAPAGNLLLTKSASVATAKSGDTPTFTIQYQNTGGGSALSSVITDTVPVGTTLVAGTISSGGTLSGTTITWNVGTVAAGATGSVSFQVKVN